MIGLGVFSSLVSSLVWLLALRFVKPKIDISPYVVEGPSTAGNKSSPSYRIKIINRSRRSAVGLQFELAAITPRRTKGGSVRGRRMIPIAGPPPLILPGRRADSDGNNYRMHVSSDLRHVLEGDSSAYLRLRIFAQDELSGVGRVFEQSYYDPKADIVQGRYAKGQSFEVIE